MKNPVIIFRVTSACNLNCTYCYDKENHNKNKNVNEEITHNIDNVVEYLNKLWQNENERKHIIFHGGEPLLANANTYENLIERILEKHSNATFSIQTNGTLLTEEHIEIFKKYKVSIGISLDGYDEKTNKYRVYNNNVNSFNMVMNKIKLMKQKNVKFGVIFTITKEMLGKEKELYEFIANNQLRCSVRPAFGKENNGIIMTPEEYYKFFTELFELWYTNTSKVSLRQITELYEEFVGELDDSFFCKVCSNTEDCFKRFVSLDIKGNLYGCNRNYNNKEFYWGNLREQTVNEIYMKIQRVINERKNKILEYQCKDCDMYKKCYGGCPANAYIKYGTINKPDDNFCEAKIQIKHYIKEKLRSEGLIEKYKLKVANGK